MYTSLADQGGISSSVLSVFFTDKFALSQLDARISVAYNSCQWKTLTKRLMPPRPVSKPHTMHLFGNDLTFFSMIIDTLREPLKTLFNIVEDQCLIFFLFWCLCCMMMFRWVNEQPGIQKFEISVITIKISMTEYHHWINHQTYGL